MIIVKRMEVLHLGHEDKVLGNREELEEQEDNFLQNLEKNFYY